MERIGVAQRRVRHDPMTAARWSLGLFVAGVLVLASACGSDDSGGQRDSLPGPPDTTVDDDDSTDGSGEDGSIDGAWLMVGGFLDGEEIALVDGWDVTMQLDGDEIGGTAACNGYGGSVTIGQASELGGSFEVGELSWTEMGCEPAVMELEQQYLAALAAVDSYELAETLSLGRTRAGTSLVFERVEPVADAELVGTTWVLDTLITGDTASNSPGMAGAFLEFSEDGVLTGSTGCRRLEGRWSIEGATIRIPVLSAIDDPNAGVCAPESEALDGDVIAVVESGSTVEVDGSRLTLTAPGGDGLSFQAHAAGTGN